MSRAITEPGIANLTLADRVALRRQATMEAALDHADRIVEERGAGAVTITEVARCLGMRPPSVYR